MSNYKVVYNGLWQINILNVDINALDRIGTDPKAFEKLWYQNARNIGIQPIEPNQGIFSQMVSFTNHPEPRTLTVEDITDAVQFMFGRDEPSERRVQLEQARLERGEIDLLTYLDNISRDDI